MQLSIADWVFVNKFHGGHLNFCVFRVHKWKLKRISGPEEEPSLPSAFKLLFAVVLDVHSLPSSHRREFMDLLLETLGLPGQPSLGQSQICVSVKVPRVTQRKEKLHIPQVHLKN